MSQVKEEKACNVSSEENKKCDVCSYATAKMSNLKRHMKLHIKVKSELNCPDCDKSFEIKKYLTAHMKTHLAKDHSTKDENKEKKKCSTCSYETHKNFNLKKHMKTHEKIKSIKTNLVCDICKYTTNKGSNLRKHMTTHKPNTVPHFEATKCPVSSCLLLFGWL